MVKPSTDSGQKIKTAHSNFRKGLSDYNDGENVTSHLGNDEYPGADLADPNFEPDNPYLEGRYAEGNDFLEELESDENPIPEDREDMDYE